MFKATEDYWANKLHSVNNQSLIIDTKEDDTFLNSEFDNINYCKQLSDEELELVLKDSLAAMYKEREKRAEEREYIEDNLFEKEFFWGNIIPPINKSSWNRIVNGKITPYSNTKTAWQCIDEMVDKILSKEKTKEITFKIRL